MPASDYADAIRRRAKEGLSGGQIAARIGNGVTRNAVCGWCRRNAVKLPQSNLNRRKLTNDQAREIRASNEPHSALAKRYGVNKGIISQIKNRLVYKDT